MNVRELIERLQEIENKELPVISPGDGGEYYEIDSVGSWKDTAYITNEGKFSSKPVLAVVLY